MYWPLGAPKIYAAHRRKRKAHDDDDRADDDSEGEEQSDEALTGLQVSRHGRRFTTITETALSVWQVSVSSDGYGAYCF